MARMRRTEIVERLRSAGLGHAVLPLEGDASLIVSERGGRIFGPFLSPEDEGLFWMNKVFGDAEAFEAFLVSGDWNQGGERLWIAPEIQFNVRDRADFWGTLATPPQMDPGDWTLTRPGPEVAELSQVLTLPAYNLATGATTLAVARHVRPVADPLQAADGSDELRRGVVYAGYEQVVTLSQVGASDIMAETWILAQLNPSGEILVPASPVAAITDYFEPIDDDYLIHDPQGVRLRITGDRRYKVGLKAYALYGRLGYRSVLPDGRAYLLIRTFPNDPSSPYPEEPPDRPGCRGHSVHVYNDGGMFGRFGELEVNGRTLGGETGRTATTDTFTLWCYAGPRAQVDAIALALLGMAG